MTYTQYIESIAIAIKYDDPGALLRLESDVLNEAFSIDEKNAIEALVDAGLDISKESSETPD